MSKTKNIVKWVMAGSLILLSIWGCNIGINFTDAGYSISNYQIFDRMTNDWTFATYLSNAFGALLMHLPFGKTMLALNVYSALLVGIMSAITFLWFISQKKNIIATYIGEIIALGFCWLPTIILYNYLSYFLLTIAIIIIEYALRKDKSNWLLLAGALLGINVWVRFPNIVYCLLILPVVFYTILLKKDKKKLIKAVSLSFAGFFGAYLLILLFVSIRYGFSSYTGMIVSLFHSSENNASYGMSNMVIGILKNYADVLKWLWIYLSLSLAGILAISLLDTCKFPRFLRYIFLPVYLVCILLLVRYYHYYGVFTLKSYDGYNSIQFFAVSILILAIVFSTVIVFMKKCSPQLRFLASVTLIVTLLTPLGSNTGVLANFNNLYIIAPFVTTLISQWIMEKQWEFTFKKVHINTSFGILSLGLLLLLSLYQAIVFGYNYAYGDVGIMGGDTATIAKNEQLSGMKTLEGLIPMLEDLDDFITNENLKECEVITYGNIPLMSYALDMPSAISTSWPDLDSYAYNDFVEELVSIDTPVIIINRWFCDDIHSPEVQTILPKLKALTDYMDLHNYTEVYTNDKFRVYTASDNK